MEMTTEQIYGIAAEYLIAPLETPKVPKLRCGAVVDNSIHDIEP